jgi:hypothetical protein
MPLGVTLEAFSQRRAVSRRRCWTKVTTDPGRLGRDSRVLVTYLYAFFVVSHQHFTRQFRLSSFARVLGPSGRRAFGGTRTWNRWRAFRQQLCYKARPPMRARRGWSGEEIGMDLANLVPYFCSDSAWNPRNVHLVCHHQRLHRTIVPQM